MDPTTPFDYAPDGAWILCSDGPELLVHGGADEAPLWSDSLPAPLVGVAANQTHVVALDRAGTLRAYPLGAVRPGMAEPPCEEYLGGQVGTRTRALALARRAPVALVLGAEGLYRVAIGARPRKLTGRAGGCLAVSPDGTRAAVGLDDGELILVQADTGMIDARLTPQAPVRAAAWLPEGHWLVAAGSRLQEISPIGDLIGSYLDVGDDPGRPDSLAVSQDGALVAWRAGPHKVVVAHRIQRQLAAEITWEREVGQVAFGPDRFLGVGLAGGDGNKFDLRTGDVFRTDTFPHRTHNSWVLLPGIDTDLCAAPGAGGGAPGPAPAHTQAPIATPPRPAGRLKQLLLVLLILGGLVAAGVLVLLKSEHQADVRQKQKLKADIRSSIRRSVREAMDE